MESIGIYRHWLLVPCSLLWAGITMQQLRHWFDTHLYQASGKDLLLVRDLMGHSSITTTTVYAAFDRAGAAAAVTALTVTRSPTVDQAG